MTSPTTYIRDKLVKIAGVMARDLMYGINETAYRSFHNYSSACMEMPVFFNVRMMWNAMDRV